MRMIKYFFDVDLIKKELYLIIVHKAEYQIPKYFTIKSGTHEVFLISFFKHTDCENQFFSNHFDR